MLLLGGVLLFLLVGAPDGSVHQGPARCFRHYPSGTSSWCEQHSIRWAGCLCQNDDEVPSFLSRDPPWSAACAEPAVPKAKPAAPAMAPAVFRKPLRSRWKPLPLCLIYASRLLKQHQSVWHHPPPV